MKAHLVHMVAGHSVEEQLEKLFKHFFASTGTQGSAENVWEPPTDVYETPDHVVVRMELAGISQSDIAVRLYGDKLVVRGVRADTSSYDKVHFRQMEIRYGPFQKVVDLPKDVDAERAQASYRDGFLEIAVPRAARGRTTSIEITIS